MKNEQLLSEIQNRPWIVGIGLFLGLGIVFVSLFLAPMMRKKAQLEKRKAFEIQRSSSAENMSAIKQAMLKESKIFLADENTAPIIELVSQLARETGVTLTSVSPSDAEKGADFVRLPIAVECVGTFHAFGNFMAKLESQPKFFKIDRFVIEERSTLRLSLRLNVYRVVLDV